MNDLKRIIDQVSKEKGIDRAVLIGAVEEAIRSAARKKYGQKADLEVQYNEETGEVEVFQFRTVVEKVADPETEISLEEARALDPESQLGDSLGVKLDTRDLGRIAAQTAKQIIIQKIKSAERDLIYEEYKDRVGHIVAGSVQRFDRGNIIINLGRTEAILPVSEQIPTEHYRRGDRIRALIIEVRRASRDPQIVLSRSHPDFLAKLFELEVPEIQEGVVKIMGVAREPGSRAKIAVVSSDPDIDPVGACVGLRGSRVQAIVQELKGEKIDIVPWNPDPAKYVYNALSPAECSKVIVDEANKALEVVVPDDQLSLAIGRQGQNVRLASKLLGWKIDVCSETQYARRQDPGFKALLSLDGLEEPVAAKLYDAGISSPELLAQSEPEQVAEIAGLSQEEAKKIIEIARSQAGN